MDNASTKQASLQPSLSSATPLFSQASLQPRLSSATPLFSHASLLLKPLSLLLSSCFYTCSYSPQYYSCISPLVHLSILILPPSPLHFTNMYPLCFPYSSFPHSSSHAIKTQSLKCLHKSGMPMSTNLNTSF